MSWIAVSLVGVASTPLVPNRTMVVPAPVAVKFVPVMVTGVPPSRGPLWGVRATAVGATVEVALLLVGPVLLALLVTPADDDAVAGESALCPPQATSNRLRLATARVKGALTLGRIDTSLDRKPRECISQAERA